MKASRFLMFLTYIAIGIIAAVSVLAIWLTGKQLNNPIEKLDQSSFQGVKERTITRQLKLPGAEELHYYSVFQEGEFVINDYFIKIPKNRLINKSQNSYPIPTNEGYYIAPDDQAYVFIPIDIAIFKSYLIITMIFMLIFLVATLFALVQLALFARSVSKSEIFTKKNISHLIKISYTAIFLMVWHTLWINYSSNHLSLQLNESMHVSQNISLVFRYEYLLIILFIFTIVQAFKEGVRLKEDNSLTI
jgi:hypothetical protein